MILDAWYFGRLESNSLLIHVDSTIIFLMVMFVYLAVLKDLALCLITKHYYYDEGMDLFTTCKLQVE